MQEKANEIPKSVENPSIRTTKVTYPNSNPFRVRVKYFWVN